MKLDRIGIIVRTKADRDYREVLDEKTKKFTLIENIVIRKLRQLNYRVVRLDPHNLDIAKAKKCSVVWFYQDDFSNIRKETFLDGGTYADFLKKIRQIKSLKNLYPSKEYLTFIHNKCDYLEFAKENKIPIPKSICSKPTIKAVKSKLTNFNKVFIKPVLGGETVGTTILEKPYTNRAVTEYLRKIRKLQYKRLLIQQFMEDFATKRYPEIRTVWVGKKMLWASHTIQSGFFKKITYTVPKSLTTFSKKVIAKLEEKFNFDMTTCRIDWGKTPNGGIFLNEIEGAGYGTFANYDWEKVGKLDLAGKIVKRFLNVMKTWKAQKAQKAQKAV